ncbi:NF-X1 type zinc finger [Cooperia oncophora]
MKNEMIEVLEAHTMASFLPTVEHVVLIGDHQQLRPSPAVYELAREYNLEVSMFERLVKNGHPFRTLQVQHRMNTDISSNIIRPYFYPDVADDPSVLEYPDVPGMDKKCFFWMHDEPETTNVDALSRSNTHEVNMIVALVSYLQKQEIKLEEITIITTYSAQQTEMRQAVINKFGRNENDQPSVAVETVDGFQGKENRIVIVSLVRSMMDGIGFLEVRNRITVALTRARHGMYVIGNLVYLADCSSFWRQLGTDMYDKGFADSFLPIRCQRHGNVQKIEHPNEFAEKSPEGGCMEICDAELPCGHNCPRRCHPNDDHDTWKCTGQCMRRCKDERYLHPCQRTCSEPCGDCAYVVKIRLKCGHSTNVMCYTSDKAVCHERCNKILDCGHQCPSTCGKPCDMACFEPVTLSNDVCNHSWTVVCSEKSKSAGCPMRCPETLPCGHCCEERCGQPCTVNCNKLVRCRLACGHNVRVPCYESEKPKQCEEKVLQDLEHCGHSVMMPCHAGTNPSYCPAPCDKQLSCGHKCLRKCAGECKCETTMCSKVLACGHQCAKRCGERCEPCTSPCLTSCKHQDCGSSDRFQVLKYGRNCSQPCVLCPKLCDNSCQHRSCSKKCYEVCDVKPCEQPCTMRLPCGHGCLGMCGRNLSASLWYLQQTSLRELDRGIFGCEGNNDKAAKNHRSGRMSACIPSGGEYLFKRKLIFCTPYGSSAVMGKEAGRQGGA